MSAHGAIAVFFLLLWLVVAVVIGMHASNRGRSGVVWGLLTFIFGIFALVAYAIVLAAD